ncbi:hypothetical protein FZC78_19065 [Rossellomorea vietnamensis]|uniref:Uncharacterized protein n=1 Tax=Rossellomorea vietnamensis TaxID=218284 RepID=A0A5D4NL89_9BACI|nr:hypothetical protein [Rossellomorea vietnamensis]TYS14258.1 hypothetical protein FZC78_19065 [Rossellomorea vietnamensis]
MIEGKGLGNKKVNRVNISLTNKMSAKLNRLSNACNMKPTTLACLLVEKCLNDPELVFQLQQEHGVYSAYKIVPVKDFNTGELQYILNEG